MGNYLQRRRNPLRDQESTIRRALSIILGHQIVGNPYPVGVLGGTLRIQRRASVPRQRGEDDTMFERDLAIGDRQWLEQLRIRTLDDGHVGSIIGEWSSSLSKCDAGHGAGILDAVEEDAHMCSICVGIGRAPNCIDLTFYKYISNQLIVNSKNHLKSIQNY